MHFLNVFSKEYFSSDENLNLDGKSNTETSDEESIAGNASNTEQNLSSEDGTINPNTFTTGENLIIDENTVDEPHSISYKVQTIKMKQIIKLYLSPCDCRTLELKNFFTIVHVHVFLP